MGNGNRIWLLFVFLCPKQELFDRNLPHIAEFATVAKSLPYSLRKAHKLRIFNRFFAKIAHSGILSQTSAFLLLLSIAVMFIVAMP